MAIELTAQSAPEEWSCRPSGRVALPLVALLFVAVTALRWFLDGSGQAVALLYVVPIAVCALWLGRRAGLGAAAIGTTLFVVLATLHGRGDLDATGWVGPPLAMGVVGGLVGQLSESAREARRRAARHAEQLCQLEALCERQQAAVVVSDALVQKVAAARWMLEVGDTDKAVDVLTASVTDGIAELRGAWQR